MNLGKFLVLFTLLNFSTEIKVDAQQIPIDSPIKQDLSQAYPADNIYGEAEIWQKDPFLQSYAQEKLQQKSAIGIDGAIAENREVPSLVQVGWQRLAFEPIAFGVATKNRESIRQGLLAYRWAFERQSADGSFGVSQYPEVVTFFGSFARSLLLLKMSGFNSEANELSRYLAQMQLTLSNPDFVRMEESWDQREQNNPVTNQLFWSAFCYHLIDLVQNQPRLAAKARSWIEKGLKRQTVDGVFPENFGSDTHYQQVSLELLSLYSFYDPKAKSIIAPYLKKGFDWHSLRVLADGTIDFAENTRTGKNQERGPSGEFKQARFGSPLPYIFWGYLGGGLESNQIGLRIAQAAKNSRLK